MIPTYRARPTIRRVVERALDVCDAVIVVDDACPERTGELVEPNDRVTVITHAVNRGVGGATKTGIAEALRIGAVYVVKLDADDQMDAAYVADMIDVLEQYPEIEMVKGNRFSDPATLRTMPAVRLIGNAALSFLVKFASGYWTVVDPTNGFIALRAAALRRLALDRLADRYFFEIDLLCSYGLQRNPIAEMEMPAIYRGEASSLSIGRVLAEFPPLLFARFLRRLLVNYLIVEINVATLCAAFGFPLLIFALVFGTHEWLVSVHSGVGRPTGTIMLSLIAFMTGFQLTLQAMLYDVQFATRSVKVRRQAQPALVAHRR